MLPFELPHNFFTLFGLDKMFRLDPVILDKAYLGLQSQYHPDRAAHLEEAVKQQYLSKATHINTAYQTLKYPANRARYLLQLADIDTMEETNTSMPTDFLMAQIQWRENINTAQTSKNSDALQTLHQLLRHEIAALDAALEEALDQQHDLGKAALLVRKYRFYEKLDEEIGDAIESILF